MCFSLSWMQEKLDSYLQETDDVLPEKILMNRRLFEKYDQLLFKPKGVIPILAFNGIPIQLASWVSADDMIFLAPSE